MLFDFLELVLYVFDLSNKEQLELSIIKIARNIADLLLNTVYFGSNLIVIGIDLLCTADVHGRLGG